jgi:hypothetical protein
LGHGLKAEHKRGNNDRSGHKSRQHDPDPLVKDKRDLENPRTTDAPQRSSNGRALPRVAVALLDAGGRRFLLGGGKETRNELTNHGERDDRVRALHRGSDWL